MPELPEIETVKSVIEPKVKGLTIEKVTVNRPEVIAYPAANQFCDLLTGQTISRMERRGKFLLFALDSGDRMVLHLRMTGCLLLTPAEQPEEKHTHVIFELNNGMELRFSDMRRFGRFWLIRAEEKDTYSGIDKLGSEPFGDGLTAYYLEACFGKRKKPVKMCLMDQKSIAGIGNIYSDEILFSARLHPGRPASSLSAGEWARLAETIPEVLAFFIEKNAVTQEEYLRGKGQDYRNTPFLQVYGREGGPCKVCKTSLCRIVIGGRSSTYCPVCQKEFLQTVE